MAITADKIRLGKFESVDLFEEFAIATNSTVYVGALVNLVTTTGRCLSATAAASRTFAGEVTAIKNYSGSAITAATGNTAGTIKAIVKVKGGALVSLKTSSRTYSNLGKTVLVQDNDGVAGTSVGTATLRVPVGTLVSFYQSSPTATVDKTQGWVLLREFASSTAST